MMILCSIEQCKLYFVSVQNTKVKCAIKTGHSKSVKIRSNAKLFPSRNMLKFPRIITFIFHIYIPFN